MASDVAPVRFGILGCASIARKNARAISLSGSCELVALASRHIEKARDFARDCGLSSACKLYDAYQLVIDDPDVEAVYIPLPTTLHLEWVRKAAVAKKHVLVDKPVAVTMEQTREMIEVCSSHGVRLMDGVMFMHHSRLRALLQTLTDPLVGPVKTVRSSFSFRASPGFFSDNIRVKSECDPLGALGDLGWYCVRLGLLALMGVDLSELQGGARKGVYRMLPRICQAQCFKWTDDGVPLDCFARVGFSSSEVGADPWEHSLSFDCSFLVPFRQNFEIITCGDGKRFGDKILRCDDFVLPWVPSRAAFTLESHPKTGPFADLDCRFMMSREEIVTSHCTQEAEMFRTFAGLVRKGVRNDFWPKAVILSCLESMRSGGAVIEIALEEKYLS